MLILYRNCETKKRPSAQRQELEKRHSAAEGYHRSRSLGPEAGGPRLFHHLKPCSRVTAQRSPSGELSSRVRPSHSCLGSRLAEPERSQPRGLPSPAPSAPSCQHTAGSNAHPALGGLTRG